MGKRGVALLGVVGIMAAIVLPAVLSTAGAKEKRRRPPPDGRGDVDMDGWVTKEDSDLVAEFLVGLMTLTAEQFRRADVDGNGKLSLTDVLLIEQYRTGQAEFLRR